MVVVVNVLLLCGDDTAGEKSEIFAFATN
jgi:hypothetical protein